MRCTALPAPGQDLVPAAAPGYPAERPTSAGSHQPRSVTDLVRGRGARSAVRCAWVKGRLVGYSRALRGILYAKQGGDDRDRWSASLTGLPDPCTRSACISPLTMSGRPTLAQPPLRPVTPAVRLLFRRCEDVDDLAVPKPSSYHFTLRRFGGSALITLAYIAGLFVKVLGSDQRGDRCGVRARCHPLPRCSRFQSRILYAADRACEAWSRGRRRNPRGSSRSGVPVLGFVPSLSSAQICATRRGRT